MELQLNTVDPTINAMDAPAAAVMMEDTEPLPNVILGSDSWHGQVPEVSFNLVFKNWNIWWCVLIPSEMLIVLFMYFYFDL